MGGILSRNKYDYDFMTMLFRGWQKRIKFFLDWSRAKKPVNQREGGKAQNCSCVLLSQWKKPDQRQMFLLPIRPYFWLN